MFSSSGFRSVGYTRISRWCPFKRTRQPYCQRKEQFRHCIRSTPQFNSFLSQWEVTSQRDGSTPHPRLPYWQSECCHGAPTEDGLDFSFPSFERKRSLFFSTSPPRFVDVMSRDVYDSRVATEDTSSEVFAYMS